MRTSPLMQRVLLDELDGYLGTQYRVRVGLLRDLILDLAELQLRVSELEVRLAYSPSASSPPSPSASIPTRTSSRPT